MLKHENQEDQNQAFKKECSKAKVQANLNFEEVKNNSDSELKSGLEFLRNFERRYIAFGFSSVIEMLLSIFITLMFKVDIILLILALIFNVLFIFCKLCCNPISRSYRKEYANHLALFELTSLGKVLETGRLEYIEPILSKVLPKITSENAHLLTAFQRTKLSYCLTNVREKTYFPNLKSTKSLYLPLAFELVGAMKILNDPIFIPDLLFCARRKSSKNPEVRKLAEFAMATAENLIKFKRDDIPTLKSEFQTVGIALQPPNHTAIESEKTIINHYLNNALSGKKRLVALVLAGLGCLISALISVRSSCIDGEFVGNPLPSIGIYWGAIAIITALYFVIGKKSIKKRLAPNSVSNKHEELSIGILQNPIHLSNLLTMSCQSLTLLGEKQTDEVYRSIIRILSSCSERQPFTLSRKDKRILKDRIALYYENDILDSDRDQQFRLSILHALPIIGDESFLKQVRRYSEFQIRESNPQIAELKEAAQECLPKLEVLVERQKSSAGLLRASSVNETSGETLLRAATGQEDSQPQTLLRASVKSVENPIE